MTRRIAGKFIIVYLLALLLLTLSPQPAFCDSFFSQFKDPKDGAFDTSKFLLKRKGFLPVPILVSDPAVGYGGGAALLFFHESAKDKEQDKADDGDGMLSLPPSVSAVAGAYTENESWLAAGAHLGSWKDDRIRYTGALGGASLNLKFYGAGLSDEIDQSPLGFNIEGFFLFQEMVFRISKSNFFLGGRYQFLNANTNFDTVDDDNVDDIPGVSENQLDSNDSGLGVIGRYDSRDNIFSPNRGQYAELIVSRYDNALGGDFDYTQVRARSLSWWQVLSRVVLGVRLDGRFTEGDTPFYALPFIDIRGIPALRYQGENVIVAEIEPRWDVTDRWSLTGFVGSGWTADSINNFGDSSGEVAGGGGFRYLIARRLGLRVGLDIARGPEDTVVYLTVGSGWIR